MQDRPDFLMGVFPLICISIDTMYPIYEMDVNPSKTYTHICVPTKSVAETLEITHQLLAKLDKLPIHPKNVFFANFIKYRNPNRFDDDVLEELKKLPRMIPPKYNYYDWCGFMLPNFIKKPKLAIHFSTSIKISVDTFIQNLIDKKKLNEFSEVLMDDDALRTFSNALMKGNEVKGEILYNSIRKCFLAVRGIIKHQHDQLTIISEGGTKHKRSKKSYRNRTRRKKYNKGFHSKM